MTHSNLKPASFHASLRPWPALFCAMAVTALAAAPISGARAVDATPATPAASSSASPPPSAPEFGGQCTEGLAEGQHVKTQCTTTWTDKDGKTYCFSNDDAKKSFLQNPADNLQRARSFAAASNVESTEKAMQDYTGTDAEVVVKDLINTQLKANNGLFPFDDSLNGNHLKLAYDDVDFTRTIDGYGFFPDVKFHDPHDSAEEVPDRFLGHTRERQTASAAIPHL